MKRTDGQVLCGGADEAGDPPAHLPRRLVGERHRQDLPGQRAAFQEMGNPADDDAGLPRPRSRQDEQRPFSMKHRAALLGIEAL